MKVPRHVQKECIDAINYYKHMAQLSALEAQPRAAACYTRAALRVRAYLVREGYACLVQEIQVAA